MLILFTVAMPPHTRPNIVCLPLKDTHTYDIHDHAYSLFTSESSITVSELKVDYKYIIINLIISPYAWLSGYRLWTECNEVCTEQVWDAAAKKRKDHR